MRSERAVSYEATQASSPGVQTTSHLRAARVEIVVRQELHLACDVMQVPRVPSVHRIISEYTIYLPGRHFEPVRHVLSNESACLQCHEALLEFLHHGHGRVVVDQEVVLRGSCEFHSVSLGCTLTGSR